MFKDQGQKNLEFQCAQTQSGEAVDTPESITSAEPAPVVLEVNTAKEEEIIQQTEQKHPESDDKLKTLPAAIDGVSIDELPALRSPKKDIKNSEMDPQKKGSKMKRSTSEEYGLVTFEDEQAKESKKVKISNSGEKSVCDDDTPSHSVLPRVNILETEEMSDGELPELNCAELPADSDEVSEDEVSVPKYSDEKAGDEEMKQQRKESKRTLATRKDYAIGEEGKLSTFKMENVSDDNLPAPPVLQVFNIPEIEEMLDEEPLERKYAILPADTEVVSEDELPVPEHGDKDAKDKEMKSQRKKGKLINLKVKTVSDENPPAPPVLNIPETEEVSDEELPEPKRAKLPADTEVVSDDELPGPKDHAQDVEDEEIKPLKKGSKRKLSTNEDYEIKKEDEEGRLKSKKLLESDRYWRAVNKDPTDFTGWSYLLQFVDQDNDVKAAREAYDAFLSHYPYCYGYWRRYADYEKNNGNKKKCEEVFERGLKAIPLSVDLWIHYLSYVKNSKEKDEEYLRSQFERALTACSLDFRSDPLWELYIKWEFEEKRLQKVTAIFDRLLATPTLGYTSHFDNFQEYVASNPPSQILDENEFLNIRTEVRSAMKIKENIAENADIPPGAEDSKLYTTEKETKSMKERIVSIRRKVYINTVKCVKARWEFEKGIKRPYFHVKPLERCQLKNWENYLNYEIQQGDKRRIIVLFERCLIACALYEDFWVKYISFLESLQDADVQKRIRDLYERSCIRHHLKNPNLNLKWAYFEEASADFNRAAEILANFETQMPNYLLVNYSRIHLERRRGNFDKCTELFEYYIANVSNTIISSGISVKYSRFCLRMLKDIVKAQDVLEAAIAKDPGNSRLYLMLVDLILQKEEFREDEVLDVLNQFLEKENVDLNQKILFAQRKIQFIEDFGANIQLVEAARKQYTNLQKLARKSSIKNESESSISLSSKIEKKESQAKLQCQSYNDNYGNSPWSNQPWYNYYGLQQGEYIDTQYGQGSQYQYQNQNWQPSQDKYADYHQWTSY